MKAEVDLAGRWFIRADPGDAGVRERWWAQPQWEDARDIDVPSAWQHTLGVEFKGVAWYRRTVRVPREWIGDGRRVWLCFRAVATDCRVWVGESEVGRHIGDYLPFQFDVTAAARQAAKQGKDGEPAEVAVTARVDEVHAPRPAPGVLVENGHITKGFHDVLSLQHGGIWDRVYLRVTGSIAAIPDGIAVRADPVTGEVRIEAELEPGAGRGRIEVAIAGPDGAEVGRGEGEVVEGSLGAEATIRVRLPRLWSPQEPMLYTTRVRLLDASGGADEHNIRFGFRSVTTGGANNRNILLNGRPVCIRGMLHWGHEPRHIAPAPPREQVRAEFAHLRELGFNCVCMCMWYAPAWFYDIADEMGMLIWQEHPIWKSPMEDAHLPEYKRLCAGFFRRDRSHPSVVIVSGSCEHERIHPDLASWWWETAARELANGGALKQVQTAFLAWCNPQMTDLHDEHVYESTGRWVAYLSDLQRALAKLPARPFVMGETVISTAWIDTEAFGTALPRAPGDRPWWAPKGLDECAAYERQIEQRWGLTVLERFRRQAAHHALLLRKEQSELFRMYANHAGWVMNQIRDVPPCRLGLMDELERWRFTPEQTLPWLAECPILFWTPDHRRGFAGGRSIEGRVGVANFAAGTIDGAISVEIVCAGSTRRIESARVRCEPGDVQSVQLELRLPRVEAPTRMTVRASAPGLSGNAWELWVFPALSEAPADVARLDGLPFESKDLEPQFEERAYSSGWGLACETWRPVLPDPTTVLFKAPLFRFDGPIPTGTRAIVTHKLTNRLVEFMESGGRVVLLSSRTRGGLDARYITVWGQVPLIPETGPLGPGDSDWIVDLLHHDLTRRYVRAIPVDDLGIADAVEPIVRMVFTHDRGVPRPMDGAFAARVGKGLLIATSLDHTEDAGRWLLERFLRYALEGKPACSGRLEPEIVRRWTIEAS